MKRAAREAWDVREREGAACAGSWPGRDGNLGTPGAPSCGRAPRTATSTHTTWPFSWRGSRLATTSRKGRGRGNT
jgi:hypothetical protein